MSLRSAARLAALVSYVLVVAASASAGPIDFAGEIPITIQLGSETLNFTLQGGGVAILDPSGAGLHLTAVSLPAGAIGARAAVAPVTDPALFPIMGIQITAANGAGALRDSSGRLGGAMPLVGTAKICMFGPCGSAVANAVLPLSVIGQGGTARATAAVNLTVVGAPWTTATADVGAATIRGNAHGPASATSSTAQAGGGLNAVTPIFISSNIGAASVWHSFARLDLRFGETPVLDCNDDIDNDGDGLTDFPADPGCTATTDFSEHQFGHVCDDGVDNDQDGFADFPADPGCTSATDATEATDCQDGIDNDGDGRADFPDDPGCTSAIDESEHETGLVCDDGADNDADGAIDFPADAGCTSASDPSETGDCQDGIDDDGDGLIDFPADPGCTSTSDVSEHESTHICDDGIDNDHDGSADYPADLGCSSALDETESSSLACDDGLDNDGDRAIDFPADPGCASSLDDSERGPTYACDDGVDNDADGATDFPDDRGCTSATGASEVGQCQDGLDNDGDQLIDFPADPDCSAASDPTETPNPECSDGIDNDYDGAIDYPADAQCTSASDISETAAVRWEVAQGGNGHFYEVVTPPLSWTNARPAAGQRTPPTGYGLGHLASFSSAAEEAFVDSTLGHAEGWIGFTDEVVEGEWRWIDATPGIWQDPDNFANPIQTAYVDWAPGEPNNATEDYALFGWSGIRWNDGGDYPALVRSYYVEYEPAGPACGNGGDDDGDGLADYPNDPGCSSATDDSERDPSLICDDGIDNDGDGQIDFPADAGCTSPTDTSETTDCNDGVDNDGDGQIDFPADPGCTSAADTSERQAGVACDDGVDNDGDRLADYPDDPGCSSPADGAETSSALACDDGIDNDGDGRLDYRPQAGDQGCSSLTDSSERDPALICDDGIDNDGDGVADYPQDAGCTGPGGISEVGDCQDGIDDDGDGLVDFPADPGCTSASDGSEQQATHICDDGIDNDHDGAADYPADPGCSSALDETESSQIACDDGLDNDGDGAVDLADAGCASSLDDSERGPTYACDDGLDNDADGIADFPDDPGCTSATGASEVGQCQDGVDNDGDGFTDFPADADCSSASDPTEIQFSGLTNGGFEDGGSLDFDDSFFVTLSAGSTALPGWVVTRDTIDYQSASRDGLGHDIAASGDRSVDLDGTAGFGAIAQSFATTPGQTYTVRFALAGNPDGRFTASEPKVKHLRVVAGGTSLDLSFDTTGHTDADVGWITRTFTFSAVDPTTTLEFRSLDTTAAGYTGLYGPLIDDVVVSVAGPACSDGVDNDGDGLVDFPADPGCGSAKGKTESPACNDGIDNDGDGTFDFDGGAVANGGVALGPPDPHCTTGHRNSETTVESCGLGVELVGVLPLLAAWRARRRRA